MGNGLLTLFTVREMEYNVLTMQMLNVQAKELPKQYEQMRWRMKFVKFVAYLYVRVLRSTFRRIGLHFVACVLDLVKCKRVESPFLPLLLSYFETSNVETSNAIKMSIVWLMMFTSFEWLYLDYQSITVADPKLCYDLIVAPRGKYQNLNCSLMYQPGANCDLAQFQSSSSSLPKFKLLFKEDDCCSLHVTIVSNIEINVNLHW